MNQSTTNQFIYLSIYHLVRETPSYNSINFYPFHLYLCIYQPIYLSIYLSVCLSVCLSSYLSIYLSKKVKLEDSRDEQEA